MRNLALLSATVLLLLAGAPLNAETKDDKQKQAGQIAKLIEQLDDEEFDTREEASKKLRALGLPALPALIQVAASTKVLEVRLRATRLVRAIMPTEHKSKSIDLEMVRILAGQFKMGSPTTERGRRGDETQHTVRITRPFYLGTYEVTQQEYRKVMKASPSWFADSGEGKGKVANLKTDRFPVELVSWYDALEFCNNSSKLDGFAPYYQLAEVKREDGSISSATVKVLGGGGYRLPTEAEWEFACRADTSTPWHFGQVTRRDTLNVKPLLVGSGYGSSYQWPDLGRTCKVGSYKPNAWGLYDMHGNAGEWCWDLYDKDVFDTSPRNDPRGPDKGKHRVMRGGSWLVPESSARSASRFFHSPEERKYYGGFRIARNP